MDSVTRDDLIRAGACVDGVYAWCDRHAPNATALPIDTALALADESEADKIRRAKGLDGNGNGNGDGDGYGYGSSSE